MRKSSHNDLELEAIERDSVVASDEIEELMGEYRELHADMEARKVEGGIAAGILLRDIETYEERLGVYREKICAHMDSAEVLVGTGGEILATRKRESKGEFIAVK